MATQHADVDVERTVSIAAAPAVTLEGTLGVPDGATGIILFAHGSGSSRLSPRNRLVARLLREARLGTLLLDLLAPTEADTDEVTAEYRFNIPLLANRLVAAIDWLALQPETAKLPVGLFGASTGAAAAIVAATERPERVRAVVSRGGRPDLAGDSLTALRVPTLLIVGGLDPIVIALNEQAKVHITSYTELAVVDGATHLFEEPGKLDEVASLARKWFTAHLGQEASG